MTWDPFKDVCPAPEASHGPRFVGLVVAVIGFLGALLAGLQFAGA